MDQLDLKKGMDGRDAPDNDVTALLSALPRVEAPANFEFGVRAKIASGRPNMGWSFLPLLKLAAPFVLLFVVTGFVFFYATTVRENNVPEVAEAPNQTQPVSQPVVVPEIVTKDDNSKIEETSRPEPAVASRRAQSDSPKTASNRSNRNKDGSIDLPSSNGGSVDFGVRERKTILPRGFQSPIPRRAPNANVGSTSPEVPLNDVLGILGVTADFSGGICKVSSVAENSLAARAGMKTGDVIETIDGRSANAETKLKGEGSKSFVVRRDGKRLNVKIGN